MAIALSQGLTVAGRYRLERKVGEGGMGEVWAATQSLTRKQVALKFLKGDGAADAHVRKRFIREARAVCAVMHPNIVEIHDVVELEDGAPVIVMEFLEGESLEARFKRDGKMPLGELAAVMVRVVAAVGTAHARGIVHRDLKPENVFLASTPDGVDVKVLDFGIAKLTAIEGDAAQTGGLTQTGAMLGTPFYMSPEQAFGEKRIDHRADIWSLGVILYRGLTGVLPTMAENIGQILKIIMTNAIPPIGKLMPELPADVKDLVGRMLSQHARDRPTDLREVKETLERHAGVVVEGFGAPVVEEATASDASGVLPLQGATEAAPASSVTVSGNGSSSKRRTALYAVGAIAMLAAGMAAAFAVFPPAPADSVPEAPTAEPAVAAELPAVTTPAPGTPPIASSSIAIPASGSTAPTGPTAAVVATTAPGRRQPGPMPPATSPKPAASPAASPAAAQTPPARPTSIGGVVETPSF
jgi:eukaryotic-like serine/threonine-protein kinase